MDIQFHDVNIDTTPIDEYPIHDLNKITFLANQKYLKLSYKDLKEYWAKFLETEPNRDFRPIDFYIHIPFCVKKCYACCFDTINMSSPFEVDHYVSFLV